MLRYFFIFLFFTIPSITVAQYKPLVKIPIVTDVANKDPQKLIVEYAEALYKFGIGLAAALAIIMLILGGAEYATTDAIGGKEEGKERMRNAVLGLLLALSSFLILSTIDKRLVNLNLNITEVTIEGGALNDLLDDPNFDERDNYDPPPVTPPEGAGGQLVDIPSGIRVDSKGKQIDITMQTRLQTFADELKDAKINWAVTEAYPPTRSHRAPCHQDGTCIDANFRNMSPTPENVRNFIKIAESSGLRAVYEVQNQTDYDRLKNGGVPTENLQNLGSHISAPHFSVYSN